MKDEPAGAEITLCIYERVHLWHGEFQFVRDSLHRKKWHTSLPGYFRHRGSFHINGTGGKTLRQRSLLFYPQDFVRCHELLGSRGCGISSAGFSIDNFSGKERVTDFHPVAQAAGQARREQRQWLVQIDRGFSRQSRCLRSNAAAYQHRFLRFMETQGPADTFDVFSFPAAHDGGNLALKSRNDRKARLLQGLTI